MTKEAIKNCTGSIQRMYQFICMPFKLEEALGTYQRAIDFTIWKSNGTFLRFPLVYLYDIVEFLEFVHTTPGTEK